MKAKLINGKLQKSTTMSAGYDLFSKETKRIKANTSEVFKTGVSLEIEEGYEGQVRARSGLNFKNSVFPAIGTIDSDYRGEVMVKLYNLSDKDMFINEGDRIAQLVIAKHYEIEGAIVLDKARGDGGFGSTGGINGIQY